MRRARLLPAVPRTHPRRGPRQHRRARPGGHGHDHQSGDGRRPDGDVLRRRKLLRFPHPRRLFGDRGAEGLRPADAQGPQARRQRGFDGGLRARAAVAGGGHGHGHEARADRGRRAVLGRRPHRGSPARARRREHRGRGRQRRRVLRAEPGARPEPGRDAGRLRRPDRARPAGRQGAGGGLPGRVGRLAVAVHAGRRPVRRVARRGAARPPGDLVRLRLAVGDGPLHHQPARDRREAVVRRGRRLHDPRGQPGRQRQAGPQRAPGRPVGAARGGVLQPAGRLHRRGAARPQREEGRQHRLPDRRPGRDQDRSERSPDRHPPVRLPEGEDGRLEPDRRLQHPGQPVHDDAPEGDPRRSQGVRSARRDLHGQVRARRPHRQLRLRPRRPDLDHLLQLS